MDHLSLADPNSASKRRASAKRPNGDAAKSAPVAAEHAPSLSERLAAMTGSMQSNTGGAGSKKAADELRLTREQIARYIPDVINRSYTTQNKTPEQFVDDIINYISLVLDLEVSPDIVHDMLTDNSTAGISRACDLYRRVLHDASAKSVPAARSPPNQTQLPQKTKTLMNLERELEAQEARDRERAAKNTPTAVLGSALASFTSSIVPSVLGSPDEDDGNDDNDDNNIVVAKNGTRGVIMQVTSPSLRHTTPLPTKKEPHAFGTTFAECALGMATKQSPVYAKVMLYIQMAIVDTLIVNHKATYIEMRVHDTIAPYTAWTHACTALNDSELFNAKLFTTRNNGTDETLLSVQW